MKQAILKKIKSLLGSAEYLFRPWSYAPDELLVLCMHSTPYERRGEFERLLDFVFKHFRALNPAQLREYFAGNLTDGPYVLFTFDDGLKNNLMAAELLEARNTRAIFFIVPDFIDATNQESYYRTHIRQKVDSTIDHEAEDYTPMNEMDLRGLLKRGHFVESHTMSHLLRNTSDINMVEREVKQSGAWILQRLSWKSAMFCSPIQTNFSVNEEAKRLIEQEYEFHFTTFPGLHSNGKNTQLVFRRNVEVTWSKGQIKYALGKADLVRWQDEIERFQRL
jgi:peptidoglycan/xylan/chitin deacetylase (PgdA/CDA1 family)